MTSANYDSSFGRPSLDADLERAGSRILSLVTTWPDWIHRRVESVRFRGQRRAVRRVSFDIQLPPDGLSENRIEIPSIPERFRSSVAALSGMNPSRGGSGPPEELHRVPLTFLRKELLAGFSMSDGAGAPIPLGTRTQNESWLYAALVIAADLACGRPVCDDMRDALWQVVISSEVHGPARWSELLTAPKDSAIAEDLDRMREMSRVRAKGRFEWLGEMLSDGFVAIALIEPSRLRPRMLIKLDFDEPLQPESAPKRTTRLAVFFGVRPRLFSLGLGAAPMISYHFEAEPPEGLVIDPLQSQMCTERSGGGCDEIAEKRAALGLAHFRLPPIPYTAARVDLYLGPPSGVGLLRDGVFLGLLSGVLLLSLGVLSGLTQVFEDAPDSLSALLLALLALAAVYLARPSEHWVTTVAMDGPRLLVVAIAGALFAAAWSALAYSSLSEVAVGPGFANISAFSLLWILLGSGAFLCAIVLDGAGVSVPEVVNDRTVSADDVTSTA